MIPMLILLANIVTMSLVILLRWYEAQPVTTPEYTVIFASFIILAFMWSLLIPRRGRLYY